MTLVKYECEPQDLTSHFGKLETYWDAEMNEWRFSNPLSEISVTEISSLEH